MNTISYAWMVLVHATVIVFVWCTHQNSLSLNRDGVGGRNNTPRELKVQVVWRSDATWDCACIWSEGP